MSVKESISLDKSIGNTLYWEAEFKEMKNSRIASEPYDGIVEDLPPRYQEVSCHIIFDVKMGDNFCRIVRMVAVGHKTTTPSSLTYSSVVSRYSLRIALTLSALSY